MMRARPNLLVLLILLTTPVLAQPPGFGEGFPSGTVGVPYTYTPPYAAQLQAAVQAAGPQLSAVGGTVTFSFSATGSPPPGLSLNSGGTLSGTPTTAGTYTFGIALVISGSVQGFTNSINIPFGNVSVSIQGVSGPAFSVQPGGLSFSYIGGAAASSQFVSVVNQGSTPATFSATVSTRSGGNWLSTPTATGTAAPAGQGSISVMADPTGLLPGTYTGYVTISVLPGTTVFNVPVLLTITAATQVISVSQTGLS